MSNVIRVDRNKEKSMWLWLIWTIAVVAFDLLLSYLQGVRCPWSRTASFWLIVALSLPHLPVTFLLCPMRNVVLRTLLGLVPAGLNAMVCLMAFVWAGWGVSGGKF